MSTNGFRRDELMKHEDFHQKNRSMGGRLKKIRDRCGSSRTVRDSPHPTRQKNERTEQALVLDFFLGQEMSHEGAKTQSETIRWNMELA